MAVSPTAFHHLLVEQHGAVVTVSLNRPPVNGVCGTMYVEIHELFSGIDNVGPDVRAVVLTGAGRHFCAGNDLDEFETMDPINGRVRMYHVREAFFAIRDCAVPVIGAVSGAAIGTGLALAASCDFVVASDDARFGLPELSVGVMGGAKHLARMVPEQTVRWMYFTGVRLTATEMLERGGLVKVVSRGELLPEALHMAEQVAAWSPTAVRLSKGGLNAIEFEDTKRGYQIEQELTVGMSGHPDSKAALAAARDGTQTRYDPLPWSRG
jgi:enoyl-CoA hydratase